MARRTREEALLDRMRGLDGMSDDAAKSRAREASRALETAWRAAPSPAPMLTRIPRSSILTLRDLGLSDDEITWYFRRFKHVSRH